jgi:putative methionine-R-sulfoxide reductase with GAF domain
MENLGNPSALELQEFQNVFLNHAEIFVTDIYGGLAGTTNRTSDYYQADETWWQAAYNGGQGAVYISEPEFDESTGALAVQIALPIRNRITGKIIGILRTTYLASALSTILDEPIGETGQADLFIPGQVISYFHDGQLDQVDPAEYASLQAVAGQGLVEMDYEGIPSIILRAPMKTLEGNPAVDNLGWEVVFHQHQEEAFAPVNTQIRGILIVMSIILILAVLTAIGNSLLLVRPITQLTQASEEIAAGNLDRRAQVTTSDEIGTLAATFNSMTAQLQETLQGLEQRVAARTKDLAIVAEVGTATATILESKRLLQEVVDLTKERFNLYHSHIYLLDEKGENLVLTAGAGEPGRSMVAEGRTIPLSREQSLVARAARERKGVTVNDVTQAPDFLPNPLLPDTRSELAVPMVVGGNVIGVFDIQSEQVGRFTDSDVNIQTTLAAQLATSIQNVRSFEQSRKQAELETMVNVIGSRIQRATSIEETLQTAIRELGIAVGASRVSANISRLEDSGDSTRSN